MAAHKTVTYSSTITEKKKPDKLCEWLQRRLTQFTSNYMGCSLALCEAVQFIVDHRKQEVRTGLVGVGVIG